MSSERLEIDLAGDEKPDEDPETRWEGYADYRQISLAVARSIADAVDAYARLDSAHAEGDQIKPAQAAEARSRILGAAIKLAPELEDDRDDVELYDEILSRWREGEEDDDRGYIKRLNETKLRDKSPAWLFQMVIDIRQAGWELGYLRAGREVQTSNRDPIEQESDNMLNE